MNVTPAKHVPIATMLSSASQDSARHPARRASSLALLTFLVALALLPLVASMLDQSYLITQFRRILIFGLAAMSLNIVLGYGGMVCFGHAAFFGLGAYVVAFINLAAYGQPEGVWAFLSEPLISWSCAATAGLAFGLIVGAVSLRTSGVYFIMVTLAFAQMMYFIFVGMKSAGGDEGLRFRANRSLASALDLGNTIVFYYLVLLTVLLVMWGTARMMRARFGIVLQGTRDNERRMKALGFETFRYRLVGLVIAAGIAALAGGMFATHEAFISPSIMHWSRSGELIVMVVLGGMATLGGPILGAVVFLTLEKFLPDFTEHWGLWFGPILVLCVLFARQGLMSLLLAIRRPRFGTKRTAQGGA